MNLRTPILCLFAVTAITGAGAGEKPGLPPPNAGNIDFATDIHPLLEARCASCHGGGKSRGGFSIESRETLLKGSETGPVVIEGKSAESRLIHVVAGLDPDVVMPPKEPRLTPEEVGALRAWIDQGLPWTLTATAALAWTPPLEPRRPAVPEGPQDNPVDRFLDPYRAAHSVVSPPPISDAQFARRAHLDIVGLLPSVKELEAFRADTAPDKREKLIDRLLENRQGYAENWISFWNDSLRNDFQGTGYIDGGRKQITAWLYQALYDNLPYDQFVAQLVNPTSANEGFVNGIVWRGTVSAAETPAMQAARNVSQVFLGVNLKCASCHDSFVNEWKLADAYGLANVFSDTPLEMVRCDVPQGTMADTKFLWPQLGTIDPGRPVAGKRVQLARLITSETNGRFTRTLVNRLWAKLMGRGLVEPLEDMAMEPWHADLLDWLATDFADHGYDLKHTLRTIVNSNAYRMPTVRADPKEIPYVFRGPEPRRLSSEQFLDALASLTGTWPEAAQFNLPNAPQQQPVRAWRLNADPLSRALGRPNREQLSLKRDEQPTTLQALEIANGATLASLLDRGAARILKDEPPHPDDLIERIYLHALQRLPSNEEREVAESILAPHVDSEGVEDLLWALVVLPEFQYL
ncbi:MAG: PSD1 and planctomycete cytochrome C domain-containing protein [FCB group bacterium]|jgi:hypothetical protein|nr:PSD1 and planctomycete cytochrome C domain-containing protein [FCB group bacterium]